MLIKYYSAKLANSADTEMQSAEKESNPEGFGGTFGSQTSIIVFEQKKLGFFSFQLLVLSF